MRASDFEISNYKKLDIILSKLCSMVEKGKQDRPDYYGMVAAAVLDPSNQIVARINRPGRDNKRVHAEQAAMLDYVDKYGPIPEGSIVITTCSPCNEPMDERDGASCTELINNSTVKKVYCGYMDPTQTANDRQFNLMETADRELRNKCKKFAATFLDKINESNVFTDARMNAIKAGKKVFKVHGKTYNVTGDISDELEAGVDENFNSLSEGLASMLVNKIFFARSNKTPKGWSYDHVGFITQDGKQIQMSGHKGNDVYITNAVTDDPEFLKQNIKIVSLPKPVSVPTTNTVGAENCGTFVANVLQANGVKGVDTQKIYSVFKKPPEQKLPENFVTEDAVMGKIADSGKIVRILKKQHTVPFSDEKNWLLIDTDPAKGNKGLGIKWIPADTRFEWVRPYRDTVDENFADGKNPQDKGDSKRHGINTKASVSSLRKTAKQGGRKGQLAHWLANMKSGRAKKK